jgi:hypothetical protein
MGFSLCGECCPAITHMDHQWRAAVLHLCFNPCRALPVAHPGCPMDHIQTLVNKSPGDLWMRCIGSNHIFFLLFSTWERTQILLSHKPEIIKNPVTLFGCIFLVPFLQTITVPT